jgi:hypothetical protein
MVPPLRGERSLKTLTSFPSPGKSFECFLKVTHSSKIIYLYNRILDAYLFFNYLHKSSNSFLK